MDEDNSAVPGNPGMMNGNNEVRGRYFWHIAEWMRANLSTPFDVSHNSLDLHAAADHPIDHRPDLADGRSLQSRRLAAAANLRRVARAARAARCLSLSARPRCLRRHSPARRRQTGRQPAARDRCRLRWHHDRRRPHGLQLPARYDQRQHSHLAAGRRRQHQQHLLLPLPCRRQRRIGVYSRADPFLRARIGRRAIRTTRRRRGSPPTSASASSIPSPAAARRDFRRRRDFAPLSTPPAPRRWSPRSPIWSV